MKFYIKSNAAPSRERFFFQFLHKTETKLSLKSSWNSNNSTKHRGYKLGSRKKGVCQGGFQFQRGSNHQSVLVIITISTFFFLLLFAFLYLFTFHQGLEWSHQYQQSLLLSFSFSFNFMAALQRLFFPHFFFLFQYFTTFLLLHFFSLLSQFLAENSSSC